MTYAAAPTLTRYKVLLLLVVLAALTYLDRLCISAAAPSIIGEFHFTKTQMGYIFSTTRRPARRAMPTLLNMSARADRSRLLKPP